MQNADLFRSEISHYLILGDQLKAQYGLIDVETLSDTLDGISDLPDLIRTIIRSSLEDELLIVALKHRVDDMQERLSRIKARFEKKRALACWAMTSADIDKIQAEDFSLSLRQGPSRLEISDEERIPSEFLVSQAPKLDRAGLIAVLKRGDVVPGAILVNGEMHIAVRVR